ARNLLWRCPAAVAPLLRPPPPGEDPWRADDDARQPLERRAPLRRGCERLEWRLRLRHHGIPGGANPGRFTELAGDSPSPHRTTPIVHFPCGRLVDVLWTC